MAALHQTVMPLSTPVCVRTVVHSGMADDAEIRRLNLRRMYPGDPFPSTRAARELGRTPAFWSDLARGWKSFGEKLARSLEEAAGLPRLSLDDPASQLRAGAHPSRQGVFLPETPGEGSIAQNLSQFQPMLLPSTVEWEAIAMGQDIPARFVLAMPDDALSPQTPRGTELIMVAGHAPPRFGIGVLVEDATGQRYIRRLVQGPAGGWIAEARDSAYRSISSADGARILAWVQGRMDGAV